MQLEIRWIEDLIALEQTGSLSRAAALRCVSQPAFSRRIQHLEQQLGYDLLVRHHKDVIFTEPGLVLLNTAKNIAKQLKETLDLLHNMQQENHLSIRFCVAHSLTSLFFSHFLQCFSNTIHHFKIEMQATNVYEGMQLLKQGDCDFMLCYADQSLLDSLSHGLFSYIEIGQTDILPVCVPDENDQCKFNLTQKFPLISYSPKAYLQQLVSQILQQHQLNYQLMYETDHANHIKDLVLQGRGVAWLPQLTITTELSQGKLKICDPALIYHQQKIFLMKLNLTQRESVNTLWQDVSQHPMH